MKRPSRRAAIFGLKCPRCGKGDLFKTPTFSFREPFEMYSHCPECHLNYSPEPGFYFGAMFISYIWTAWLSIFVIAFFHWFLKLGLFTSFAILITFYAICFVWVFRISRAMWLTLSGAGKKNN